MLTGSKPVNAGLSGWISAALIRVTALLLVLMMTLLPLFAADLSASHNPLVGSQGAWHAEIATEDALSSHQRNGEKAPMCHSGHSHGHCVSDHLHESLSLPVALSTIRAGVAPQRYGRSGTTVVSVPTAVLKRPPKPVTA